MVVVGGVMGVMVGGSSSNRNGQQLASRRRGRGYLTQVRDPQVFKQVGGGGGGGPPSWEGGGASSYRIQQKFVSRQKGRG